MDKQPISENKKGAYLEHVMEAGGAGAVSSIESLSGALKVGFNILRILMVVLAVAFLFSNIYWVPEGYVAVHSRLGRIVGGENAAVSRPGGPYLAFPFPVDKIVRVPTTIQKTILYNAFWSETETSLPVEDNRPESKGLVPGVHGSLVTADKNIVQGIWVVNYRLKYDAGSANAAAITSFIKKVGTLERGEEIVRTAARSAIVKVVSGTSVSDFIAGNIDNERIRQLVEARMTSLDTGLVITNVSASRYSVPKTLVPNFEAVSQAESQKAMAIEKASRQRVSTLSELAGSEWQALLTATDAYAEALQHGDGEMTQSTYRTARDAFLSRDVGGAVKQMLDEARSERTAEVQRIRAMVARFKELLQAHEESGKVFESQLIQDAVREIWSDESVDALYVPGGRRIFLDIEGDGASWSDF
jgi:regulator of protease activity HflC (stomatin/prohibitin superfamily)